VTLAISIGNFDGVHRGHAALIQRARQIAGLNGRVAAVTFEPHPAAILRPSAAPARLATPRQRHGWLRAAGADEVVELRPTIELLGQEPAEFIRTMVDRFHPAAIVEGDDFRFGRGRRGSIDLLESLGAKHGYQTIVVPAVEVVLTDQTVNRAGSTLTRWLLQHGRVRDAAVVLGRPYELQSTIERGDQRGRDIGFPTANLKWNDQLLPRDGVYAGIGIRDGASWPAAISVGTKSTFGEHRRVCEAYLIGYEGPVDEYGWTIDLRFVDWLRDQVAYAGIQPLVEQIRVDVANVEMNLGLSRASV
jgi:riboflavin kinase / FMN adenylyltransferase